MLEELLQAHYRRIHDETTENDAIFKVLTFPMTAELSSSKSSSHAVAQQASATFGRDCKRRWCERCPRKQALLQFRSPTDELLFSAISPARLGQRNRASQRAQENSPFSRARTGHWTGTFLKAAHITACGNDVIYAHCVSRCAQAVSNPYK